MEAEPTYEDVMRCVEALCRENPLAGAASAGKSVEGRDIPIVEITDNRASDDDKQLVVITAGTHGSEEAGRLVAMALMEWLASGEPAATLRNQKFIILPCVNPDGSVRNTGPNAEGIDIYESFIPGREPTSHEGRLVFAAVGHLNPALVVDIHGLAGGAMNEEFYVHPAFANSPVNFLAPILAEEARQAAEAAGFPQREPRLVTNRRPLPARMAGDCNCFAYTAEITENFYPPSLMRASGLLRMKALITVGDRRNYFHYYPGYPCEAISGHAMAWLCAAGRTAGRRGQNRRQLLQAVPHIPVLQREHFDRGSAATLRLSADRDLPELPRFALQMRLHKPARIKAVYYDGRELSPGEEDGFVVWEDTASRIVRVNVNVPLTKGEHAASANYDLQW